MTVDVMYYIPTLVGRVLLRQPAADSPRAHGRPPRSLTSGASAGISSAGTLRRVWRIWGVRRVALRWDVGARDGVGVQQRRRGTRARLAAHDWHVGAGFLRPGVDNVVDSFVGHIYGRWVVHDMAYDFFMPGLDRGNQSPMVPLLSLRTID